jgi:hypothetical protein
MSAAAIGEPSESTAAANTDLSMESQYTEAIRQLQER